MDKLEISKHARSADCDVLNIQDDGVVFVLDLIGSLNMEDLVSLVQSGLLKEGQEKGYCMAFPWIGKNGKKLVSVLSYLLSESFIIDGNIFGRFDLSEDTVRGLLESKLAYGGLHEGDFVLARCRAGVGLPKAEQMDEPFFVENRRSVVSAFWFTEMQQMSYYADSRDEIDKLEVEVGKLLGQSKT